MITGALIGAAVALGLYMAIKLIFIAFSQTLIATLENNIRYLAGMNADGSSNGLLHDLFQNNTVTNFLAAFTLFGIVVLVMTTILAIIRNVYKEDSKVTISSIVGQALKGALGFILVPGLALVGVEFSNIILQAVSEISNPSKASSAIAAGLWNACAEGDGTAPYLLYDETSYAGQALIIYTNYLLKSNIVERLIGPDGMSKLGYQAHYGTSGGGTVYSYDYGYGVYNAETMIKVYTTIESDYMLGFPNWQKNADNEYYKFTLDMKRRDGGFLWFGGEWHYFDDDTIDYYIQQPGDSTPTKIDRSTKVPNDEGKEIPVFQFAYETLKNIPDVDAVDGLTIKRSNNVWSNTNLNKMLHMNHSLGFAGVAFYMLAAIPILKSMLTLVFGMMKRLIMLLFYYMTSPIVLAMYPWDSGKAFASWRSDFIGYIIGAWSAVFGLNLMIVMMSVLTKISALGWLLKLLMIIVLTKSIEQLVGIISGWIGAKNLLSEGKDAQKAVTEELTKPLKVAAAGAAIGVGVAGARAAKNTANIGLDKLNNAGSDAERMTLAKRAGFDNVADYRDSLQKQKEQNGFFRTLGRTSGNMAFKAMPKDFTDTFKQFSGVTGKEEHLFDIKPVTKKGILKEEEKRMSKATEAAVGQSWMGTNIAKSASDTTKELEEGLLQAKEEAKLYQHELAKLSPGWLSFINRMKDSIRDITGEASVSGKRVIDILNGDRSGLKASQVKRMDALVERAQQSGTYQKHIAAQSNVNSALHRVEAAEQAYKASIIVDSSGKDVTSDIIIDINSSFKAEDLRKGFELGTLKDAVKTQISDYFSDHADIHISEQEKKRLVKMFTDNIRAQFESKTSTADKDKK